MPGPTIQLKTPDWLDPEKASVFDSALTKALRTIGGLLGGNDPTSQVLGLMTTELPGGGQGPLGKAIGKLNERAQRIIKAYHGSPHDFDAFSMSKVGTGEGAQAYGHGLYFAENEATADAYRSALSTPDVVVGWKPQQVPKWSANLPPDQRLVRRIADKRAIRPDATDAEILDDVRAGLDYELKTTFGHWPSDAELAYVRKQRELLDQFTAQGVTTRHGRMYEVGIKADPDDFLDWDKPLSQQSEKVKQALRQKGLTGKRWEVSAVGQSNVPEDPRMDLSGGKFYNDRYVFDSPIEAREFIKKLRSEGVDAKPIMSSAWKGELEGREAYQKLTGSEVTNPMLQHLTGGPQKATATLQQAGIPGIKYLDQGSRGGRAAYRGDPAFLHAAQSFKSSGVSADEAVSGLLQAYKGRDPGVLRAAVEEAYDIQPKATRNYVVFDDKLVDILRKYGLLMPAAGVGAASQQGEQ